MSTDKCYHCGNPISNKIVKKEDLLFCCHGCLTVYEIIKQHDLSAFYTHFPEKGVAPKKEKQQFRFLANKSLWEKWVKFREGTTVSVSLFIPNIHCSACIWILEHLQQIEPAVVSSHVQFSKRMVHIVFDEGKKSMMDIAILLDQMGYTPDFSVGAEQLKTAHSRKRSLWLKIGVAGFAFGNTMFLALPTYFEKQEPWLDGLRPWFDLLMFLLSIPVVFYAAQEYFINSFKSISKRIWSLDIPIAIGISVLFLKSTHAAFIAHELPYFDSLTGLVFFLLLGKYMQRSVYAATDFEHKYHSFFPIGVTVITCEKKECIRPVAALQKDDVMLLRPEEIIPTDGIIQQGEAHIDYSFVTGESETVSKKVGAAVYAGGRIKNQVAYIKVQKIMDESFLLQLWKKDGTTASTETIHAAFANRISKYFTPIVLSISMLAGIVWLYLDASRAVEVVVAVLIVACPCAIALSGPFIYGNMVRHFGRMGLLLKNNASIEKIAHTTHWVFDKTGTLTNTEKTKIQYTGSSPLSNDEKKVIRSMAYQSAHPMSKALFRHLEDVPLMQSLAAKHLVGLGISAQHGKDAFRIGAASFTKAKTADDSGSAIHISINDKYRGSYQIKQQFRSNLENLFKNTAVEHLSIVSGDGTQDKKAIQKFAGKNVIYRFRQNPFDKIKYIESLQAKGAKVLMMGDGLNDAGALIRSDAGIAVRNDTYMFTPKCDAILEGKRVTALGVLHRGMQKSIRLVYISFGFSLAYNTIGIGIAVTGGLSPIIAAILMPLSSVSVIAFASLSTSILYKQLKKKLNY